MGIGQHAGAGALLIKLELLASQALKAWEAERRERRREHAEVLHELREQNRMISAELVRRGTLEVTDYRPGG